MHEINDRISVSDRRETPLSHPSPLFVTPKLAISFHEENQPSVPERTQSNFFNATIQGKSYAPIKDFTWSTDFNNVEIGCCFKRTSLTSMKVMETMPAEQLHGVFTKRHGNGINQGCHSCKTFPELSLVYPWRFVTSVYKEKAISK